MMGAVVRNGDNTLVVELPTGEMDLQLKLHSIGIAIPADDISISDEEGDSLRIKLFAGTPEEAHLIPLLTSPQTLADANLCCQMLQRAAQNSLPRLKNGLLAGTYHEFSDFIEDAKSVFAEAVQRNVLEKTLLLFEADPNIRLVVSAEVDGETEVLTLPMSERDCIAASNRIAEADESLELKIEACRYKGHWKELFDVVLQDEGLYALNSFAAAFPYMEDLQAYEAIIEYADVTDSRSLIQLADHIDEFGFYPDVRDAEDVAREWLSENPYLQLSAELEDYFDYDAYGCDLQDEYHGAFVSGGYVFLPDGQELEYILDPHGDLDFQS